MSETTEMILEGILCRNCGVFIDDVNPGYPRTCEDCEDCEEDNNEKR